MTKSISLHGRLIGKEHVPAFFPDIDIYFRRDFEKAKRVVSSIAESGGEFLKAAVLHRADFALAGYSATYFDHKSGQMVEREYRTVLEEMVVPLDDMRPILRFGRDLGLRLVLSVYDLEGVEFAINNNACALKIPSSNINHKQLIEAVSTQNLPIIIDTGRSSWFEIERAVGWVKALGVHDNLILQHSPAGPPAPAAEFHMRMLSSFETEFQSIVGLSDHHRDLDMIPMAIACGAAVIEKGVVEMDNEAGIDRAHALPVSRVGEALALINRSYEALGDPTRPTSSIPQNSQDRMGCIAAREIKAGEILQLPDIGFAFPSVGFDASKIDEISGKTSAKTINAGSPIGPSDVVAEREK